MYSTQYLVQFSLLEALEIQSRPNSWGCKALELALLKSGIGVAVWGISLTLTTKCLTETALSNCNAPKRDTYKSSSAEQMSLVTLVSFMV